MNQRLSNIELLRCLSMFMVLLLHSSFLAFGMPDDRVVESTPGFWGGMILQQGIGIVAVDVFVLISGWFSIKAKTLSICSFIFQIAFLKCLSLGIMLFLGKIQFNKETITELLMLNPGQGWFIKAYLLLYILSPVLNKFSENTQPKIFSNVLIAYWIFLFLFGWITESTTYINNGYSIVSFIGLYLLGRYAKIYQPKWSDYSAKKYLSVYIITVAFFCCTIFIAGLFKLRHTDLIAWKFCSYISPLTVIGAMSLLLCFSKIKLPYNKWINICGKSCFSVYLLHAMWGYWFDVLKKIDSLFGGLNYIIVLFAFLLVVYLGCILLDQLRLQVWKPIAKCFFDENGK